MRFNAHLLQSRGGVADIGVGNEAGYSANPISKSANYYVSTDEKSSTNAAAILNSESRYRRIYVDQIYCSKYINGSYGFASFFNGSDTTVKQNELLTAGQVSDYITNATQGVMPKWLGEHRSLTSTNNLYSLISGVSDEATWKSANFNNKIFSIFNKLFKNNVGTDVGAGPIGEIENIYIRNVNATNITGAFSGTNIEGTNLSAGRNGISDTDYIFKVIGGAAPDKRIEIVRQANGATIPSGIHGSFYGSEVLSNYPSGNYSFVDVGRYYFRDTLDRGAIPTIGKSYMQANNLGVTFTFGGLNRTLTLRYPSVSSANVLTSAPTTAPIIDLYNGGANYSFFLFTRTSSNGLAIYRDDVGPSRDKYFILSVKDGGGVQFTDQYNVPIYLRDGSGIMNKAASLHILRSEAPEIIYGTNVTGYNEILRFEAGADPNMGVWLGYEKSVSDSKFSIKQYNSGTKRISAPLLSDNSEFIVNNPTSAQTINKVLNLTVSSKTITVDPNATVGAGPTPAGFACQLSPTLGSWFKIWSNTGVAISASDTSYVTVKNAPSTADQGVLIKTNGTVDIEAALINMAQRFKFDSNSTQINESDDSTYTDLGHSCVGSIVTTYEHCFSFVPGTSSGNLELPGSMFGGYFAPYKWYIEYLIAANNSSNTSARFHNTLYYSSSAVFGVADSSFGYRATTLPGGAWGIDFGSSAESLRVFYPATTVEQFIKIKATRMGKA